MNKIFLKHILFNGKIIPNRYLFNNGDKISIVKIIESRKGLEIKDIDTKEKTELKYLLDH